MPPGGQVVWRITRARHADRAFEGEGARLYGGRWNHRGTPVVYCSATLSLAALEYFVNLESELVSPSLVALSAEIPRGLRIESLEIDALPSDWRAFPAPERLKDLGTDWIRSGLSAVLQLPSVIIPQERNILLNPAHPDFAKIRPHKAQPFSFDPRMWK
jgi:RES domain-containing protein